MQTLFIFFFKTSQYFDTAQKVRVFKILYGDLSVLSAKNFIGLILLIFSSFDGVHSPFAATPRLNLLMVYSGSVSLSTYVMIYITTLIMNTLERIEQFLFFPFITAN